MKEKERKINFLKKYLKLYLRKNSVLIRCKIFKFVTCKRNKCEKTRKSPRGKKIKDFPRELFFFLLLFTVTEEGCVFSLIEKYFFTKLFPGTERVDSLYELCL